jgi:hypothetical protein
MQDVLDRIHAEPDLARRRKILAEDGESFGRVVLEFEAVQQRRPGAEAEVFQPWINQLLGGAMLWMCDRCGFEFESVPELRTAQNRFREAANA